MTLLSLDPSSSIVGYAVMRGAGHLVEAGRIKPSKTTLKSLARIREFGEEVRALIDEMKPDRVVIETPNPRAYRTNGAGLTIYGMAVGFIVATVDASGVPYDCVDACDWTKGVEKGKRTRLIALKYPQYRMDADSGMDAADAIGLGDWWYTRNGNGILCKSQA